MAGLKKGISNDLNRGLFKKMFSGTQDQVKTANFMGLLTIDNALKPVIRVSYVDGSVNFLELELIKNKQDFLIADMYIATHGQYVSDSIKELGLMIMDQSGAWLADLVNDKSSYDNILKLLKQAGAFKQKGKFKEMYQVMQKLPEKGRRNDFIQLMMITAASIGMDEETYRRELASFAKYHGDNPHYAFPRGI